MILVVDTIQNHRIAFDAEQEMLLRIVEAGKIECFDVFHGFDRDTRSHIAKHAKRTRLVAGFAKEQIRVQLQDFG
jgi:hypothetical protein